MRNLKNFVLEYAKTINFVVDNLTDTNILSVEILKMVNFREGTFSAILPLNYEDSYDFGKGLYLSSMSEPVSVNNEVANYIYKKINASEEVACIFDEALLRVTDNKYWEQTEKLMLTYENEIYYLIDKENLSLESVKNMMRVSRASTWHSLGMLTFPELKLIDNKKLSMENIKDICSKIKMIFLSAYDGEGYVIWESAK